MTGELHLKSGAKSLKQEMDMTEKPSCSVQGKYQTTTSMQKYSGYLAICCAIIAEILVVIWMGKKDTDKAYLGGLNWNGK